LVAAAARTVLPATLTPVSTTTARNGSSHIPPMAATQVSGASLEMIIRAVASTRVPPSSRA
jgi:hypothetical protein